MQEIGRGSVRIDTRECGRVGPDVPKGWKGREPRVEEEQVVVGHSCRQDGVEHVLVRKEERLVARIRVRRPARHDGLQETKARHLVPNVPEDDVGPAVRDQQVTRIHVRASRQVSHPEAIPPIDVVAIPAVLERDHATGSSLSDQLVHPLHDDDVGVEDDHDLCGMHKRSPRFEDGRVHIGRALDQPHVWIEVRPLLLGQSAVEDEDGLVMAEEAQRVDEADDPDEGSGIGHRVEGHRSR
jgi:hypothetical protein